MKPSLHSPLGYIATVAILFFALSVGGRAQSNTRLEGDFTTVISNKLAAISNAGYPVTLQELDKEYVQPPAGQNAAPLYEKAFSTFNNEDVKSATFVSDNIAALPMLIKAAERNVCRYPVAFSDGYLLKLPHLIKIKRATILLKTVAVNQAAKERTDASTVTLQAGINLARSLDKEPIMISKLVQLASLEYAVQGMEQAFTARAFSDPQLIDLQNSLKISEVGISLRQAMVGERVIVLSSFQLPDAELAKLLDKNNEKAENNTMDMLAAYRKSALFQQDLAFALDYMSTLVSLAAMPYPQLLDANDLENGEKLKVAGSKGFILSGKFLPAFTGYFVKGAEATSYIRLAQIALAIERYRIDHANSLPQKLTDLVPDFIPSIPADPFDGQPMRYKALTGKGYVVYSVGNDKKDDGGMEKSPDGKTKLDLTFTVKR
jgi:hypothetical protein